MFKRAVSLLCVVVLLFTMNTLKRTANTLERVPMCGFEEHVHDSGCYNSAGELACGMPEHVHTDACYQESPTGKGTLDDLDLRVDGLDGMGDVVDGDGAGNLDLSMDLDQGGLLDFVQSPGNQTATTGNDLQWDEPVVDAAAGSAADNADDGEQGMVVEIEDEPVEAVTETKDEEQPAETEAVTETKEEEQPAEIEAMTETKEEEQPAETEAVTETKEEEQPAETEAVTETKEEEQPAETEAVTETKEEEQPAETEAVTETKEEEQPAGTEAVTETKEEEQPAGTEGETETEEEQPAETEGETETETETEEEQPAETEGETETETEEEQPAAETEAETENETKEEEQPTETEAVTETKTEEEQPAETEGETETETETETEKEQPAETEGEAETETETKEEEQPAETEGEAETETETKEEEQPAETEGEAETETETKEEEQPAETEGETETETETKEEEQPAETEGETETETETGEEQPAETEGETETEAGDEASDDAEAAAERRYTAIVDLTDNGNQPISLREAIANATPAEEYGDAVDEAAELPVDEWSVEFDSGLFEAVATEDDVLLTPLAGFESAEVIISNGSRYELTLLNCVVEPSEGEAQREEETEAGDEAEAPVAYPAAHFEQGTDHVNVVVDAPEGAFPEGTTMTVEDVRDEGTIQSITDSVTGDFVEVTSVNAVNISFWHDGVEIEPLLPIAVVMSAVEADAHADTPVVVHVADDGETTVVDSESIGANGASLEMPAAQTFEADTFSIYAIVGTQTLDTNYIDDAGNTWSIRVSYTEEARLPEGASLKVTEVTDESYLAGAQEALESGKRITKARFFDITILDRDGNEVQPKAPVDVIINLVGDEGTVESDEEPTEVGDPSVRAIHFVEEGDGNVKVESQKATETEAGVSFAADSFSVWGVVYTVDFEVEGNQGVVTLDFTDFDATSVPEEGAIFYNTEDCNVHIALSLLEKIIRGEAEAEFDIGVDADVVNDFRFDFEKAAADKANREVALDNGEIVIGSDGFVELTDGERTLRVEVENLSALKEAQLATEGATIEVIEGNVPLGSEAAYTAHTDEETAELVENYINNEENGDSAVAGYSAADLKIVRNEETLPVEGHFKVTVDKASLVPEGMKLEKLYHIHEGEVEPLEAVPTEDGLGLVFEVKNFSDIVASYTVEFYNSDKMVVIKGGSQVLLSALIDELGLTRADGTAFTVDDVASVEFDDPELFQVAEVQKDDEVTLNADTDEEENVTIATGHDFVITSLQPFDETRMVLTLTDGEAIGVVVTDTNGNSIFSETPLFTLNASGPDQTLTVNFKNEADDSSYSVSGNYYLFAAVEKNGKKYANMIPVSGSSVTLNSGAWANLKANGNEALSLASGDAVKFYILTGENSQRADSTRTVQWGYSDNFEVQNGAYNIVEGDKIGDKNINAVNVVSGSSATANIMMGDPPKYNVSWSFVDSNGQPVNNPEIVGTYYLLATAYNSDKQPRYALSDKPVDFSSSQSVEFTRFYDNNGNEDTTLTGFNGNTMKAELVSLNDSGNKPTINQAASGNQCTKITPREHDYDSIQNETVGLYKLTGAASGAHYTITGTKMPAYKVTSVFEDSTGAAVAPALAKGYYLVVKTGNGKVYVETYDPAGDCEITQFFTEATGEGAGNNPVAYTSDMTVSEVYLVSKADAASAAAAAGVEEAKKITSGDVEFYTLQETVSTDPKQATLTFTMSGDAEMYTSTIKFFDGNAVVIEAAGDIGMHVDEAESTKKAPALSKNYYVLATLVDKMDNSNIVGWAINPVSPNGHAQTSTVFSEFIPFGTDGSTTTGTKYVYSSSEDFPYEVVTRLYRTDAPQENLTYKKLVTDGSTINATDNAESGYEFVGNWNPDATHNEIHLKEASPKTYAVRVRFKTNDITKLTGHEITADKKIMVNVKVTHANPSEYSYQYAPVVVDDFTKLDVDDEGYLYVELPFNTEGGYSYWKDQNGDTKNSSKNNPYFTGNESNIQVEIVQLPSSFNPAAYKPNTYDNNDTTKFKEGESPLGFTVHYDTRWTNPQNTLSRFHEAENPGSNVIKCYDVIDLILPSADSEYDYATILGPNYMFGITADHLFQNNDLQTNFAVNHYTGHGDYVTPDLSNTPGTIVIGEFNRNTDVMTENHVGPAVDPDSTDGEDMKAGSLHLGSNIDGSLVVYADNDSGSRYNTYGIAGGSPVVDERARVHVALQNGANLQSQIVNPAIQYGVNMSRTLAAKDATYTPNFVNGKPYVDTTGYPENATIYINADALLTVSGEQPDDVYGTLYALQNLTINKKPGQMLIFNFKNTKNVKLSQFNVKYNGGDDFYTNTTTGKSDVNNKMEEISKHIVWNFASCTGRVELSEVGGICLQPNYGSETQISGTSGGWLVSNGYVYNNSAEWHNFFREVPDSAEVTLIALKTVDNMVPGTDEKFNFDLAEYKVGTDWKSIETQQNTRSSVKFTIKDEEGTAEADKKLTPGWHVYKITEQQTKPAENTTTLKYNFDATTYYAAVHVMAFNAARVVSPPIYFRNFDESAFTAASVTGEDVPAALTNKLDTVTFANDVKKVGLSLHKSVEGTDSSKVPFTFEIRAWLGDTGSEQLISENAQDYTVTGVPGISRIRFTPEGSYSVGTIQLKNGQTATIAGLPENTHYSITETNVNGKLINTETGVADGTGYTAQTTESRTGTLSQDGTKEDFVNVYHSNGSATLKVHKVLKNSTVLLPENAFNFELYRVGGGQIETKANDKDGNVTFTALSFTEADMEGALLNPVTGKRTKVLMYRVHETDGDLTDFDYTQVINDTDKIVTVTLVDEGNGTIRASAYPADFTFRFNNERGVEVVLEGSKTLVGRDMKGGEVYRFIVTDNGNEGRTVATTTVTGARDGEKTTFTFPAIKYTEAGTHTYTIREVVPTTNDGKVTYDTHTYTATVTVTDTAGKLSANVVYSAPADFINTSNETTSASVEKMWSDGNANHTNDSVKVKLYKVYGETVNAPSEADKPSAYTGSGTDTTEQGGKDIGRPGTDYLPADATPISGTEVMLNRGNGWKHTWSKLPTIEDTGSNVWKKVSYYPVEVWSSNGSVTSTAYQLDSSTHKTTVTNTVSQRGSVKVTKAFSGITSLPDGFKITATWKEDGADKTQELTLSTVGMTGKGTIADPYTWTIGDLPLDTLVTFTESGYDVEGYAVTVTGSANATTATATAAATPGEASFVNTYRKGNITIQKEWGSGDHSAISAVAFALWGSGTNYADAMESSYADYGLTADTYDAAHKFIKVPVSAGTVTLSYLPVTRNVNGTFEPIEYNIVETGYYKQDGTFVPDTSIFTVNYSVKTGTGDFDTATTSDGEHKADLRLGDATFKAENDVHDTSITIQKRWYWWSHESDGTAVDHWEINYSGPVTKVYFNLYKDGTKYNTTPYEITYGSPITVDDAIKATLGTTPTAQTGLTEQEEYQQSLAHWTLTVTGLPAGYTYTVVECFSDGTEGVDHPAPEDCWEFGGRVYALKNILVDVPAQKTWADSQADHPAITFHLYRQEAADGAKTLVGTQTVDASTNWKCEWTKLPRYIPNNDGQMTKSKYIYTVEEDQIPGFTGAASGVYNANHTNTPETDRLDVDKEWANIATLADANGDSWPDGYVVTYNVVRHIQLVAQSTDGDGIVSYTTVDSEATSVHSSDSLTPGKHSNAHEGLPKAGWWTPGSGYTAPDLPTGSSYVMNGGDYYVTYTYEAVETGVYAAAADVGSDQKNLIGKFIVSHITEDDKTTITNTKNETYLDVVKKWSLNGNPATDDTEDTISEISFYLYRKSSSVPAGELVDKDTRAGKAYKYDAQHTDGAKPFTVTRQNGKWELHIDNLAWKDSTGDPYTYWIQEVYVPGYTNTPTITLQDGTAVDASHTAPDKSKIVITNSKFTVALPSTGGMGTGVIYGAGAALVLLALLGFIMMNRKRSEGDGI